MENFRLKVFRAVAHHLNFRRAAEELLLTQPAVTQQIRALEDEYGVPLFDRSEGRVRLTSHGATLLPFAQKLSAISEEAFEAVAKSAGTHAGQLALGASQTIGQYLLPKLIAGFMREHPRVEITAVSGNTDEILVQLAAQRIQVALIEGPAMRKDIKVVPFMEDHMVLVVPAEHEWADQDVEIEAFKGTSLVTRELGSGSRRVVEEALQKAGLSMKQLKTTIVLDSTEGQLSAVEADLGVAFVSRWAVRNQLKLGTLKVARVRALKLSRMLSIAFLRGPAPSGNVAAFHRFILERGPQVTPRPREKPSTPRKTANRGSAPR